QAITNGQDLDQQEPGALGGLTKIRASRNRIDGPVNWSDGRTFTSRRNDARIQRNCCGPGCSARRRAWQPTTSTTLACATPFAFLEAGQLGTRESRPTGER